MKFIAIAAALVSVAQAAIQGNTAFGLVAIRSGSPVHLSSAALDSNNNLYLGGSSNYFTGFMLPDGRVRVGGVDSWLTIAEDSSLVVGSASPYNFGVDDSNHLTYNGNSGFLAVLEHNVYQLYANSSAGDSNSYTVALRVDWSSSSSSSAEASASGSSVASTGASSVASTHASTVTSNSIGTNGTITAVPTVTATASSSGSRITETVTICSQDGTCHTTTGIPQVNGAATGGSIIGAAVAAVAGVFLL